MKKIYKLACNFNTVEFEVDSSLSDFELAELLQSEYNYLANIKVITPAQASPGKKPSGELATEAQLRRLDALGLKYKKDITKKEAWKLINDNKEELDY